MGARHVDSNPTASALRCCVAASRRSLAHGGPASAARASTLASGGVAARPAGLFRSPSASSRVRESAAELAPCARRTVWRSGPRWSASAPVGNGPSTLAVDPATHTIYVANGYNPNGPTAGGNTVSVIDARRCDAQDVSRCKGPWPTVTVGNAPERDRGRSGDRHRLRHQQQRQHRLGVQRRDLQRAGHVGLRADARDRARSGSGPIGIFADPANHTVYVAQLRNPTGHRLDDRQRDLQRDRSDELPDQTRHRRSRSAADPGTSMSTRPPTPYTCANADRHVGVRREHLQRDRALGVRRRSATPPADRTRAVPGAAARPRSTARTTPSTRPTATTRSRCSIGRTCNASDLAGCATADPRHRDAVPRTWL